MYLRVNISLLEQSRMFTDIKNPIDFRGNYDCCSDNIVHPIIDLLEGCLYCPQARRTYCKLIS